MEITTLVVTLTGHSAWITPSGVARQQGADELFGEPLP